MSSLIDPTDARWFRRRLRAWHKTNARTFPWRDTKDPYQILISEALLQATYSGKVGPVFEELVKRFPTARHLAQASPAVVKEMIRPLGHLHRAETLVRLAVALRDRHGGRVPSNERQLLELPGVGYYTAGAVRTFAFGARAALPDTNVLRLIHRFFGLPEKGFDTRSPSRLARASALEVLPTRGSREVNLAMLDFAAAICTFSRPKCDLCPLRQRCVFAERTAVAASLQSNAPNRELKCST